MPAKKKAAPKPNPDEAPDVVEAEGKSVSQVADAQLVGAINHAVMIARRIANGGSGDLPGALERCDALGANAATLEEVGLIAEPTKE